MTETRIVFASSGWYVEDGVTSLARRVVYRPSHYPQKETSHGW